MHCNGDATIDMMLEAHEAAGAPQGKRTVIIHSQFVRPDQLDKYASYGFRRRSLRIIRFSGATFTSKTSAESERFL